jgi:hypothetical protein
MQCGSSLRDTSAARPAHDPFRSVVCRHRHLLEPQQLAVTFALVSKADIESDNLRLPLGQRHLHLFHYFLHLAEIVFGGACLETRAHLTLAHLAYHGLLNHLLYLLL